MAVSAAEKRAIMRNEIRKVCEECPKWSEIDLDYQNAIVRRIERSCYNKTIDTAKIDGVNLSLADAQFIGRYSATCSKVIYNLTKNEYVKEASSVIRIINNEIDPKNIANMTSEELCPEAFSDIRKEINRSQNQINFRKVSTAYTCRKCGGRETITDEYQSRAVDECGTLSIKCIQCDYVWRK